MTAMPMQSPMMMNPMGMMGMPAGAQMPMMGGMMPMPMMGGGMMPNPMGMMAAAMGMPMMMPMMARPMMPVMAQMSCEMTKDGMVCTFRPLEGQSLEMLKECSEAMTSMMSMGAPMAMLCNMMPMVVATSK